MCVRLEWGQVRHLECYRESAGPGALGSQFISRPEAEIIAELAKAFTVREDFTFMAPPPFPFPAVVGERDTQARLICVVVSKRFYDLSR